jgi:hypothetical protein
MHADVGVGAIIYRHRGWHFDIGVVERCKLLFPVGIFEFEEHRSKHLRIVQRFVRKDLNVTELNGDSRRRLCEATAANATGSAPTSGASCWQRDAAFTCIETPVPVYVKSFNQCLLLTEPCESSPTLSGTNGASTKDDKRGYGELH